MMEPKEETRPMTTPVKAAPVDDVGAMVSPNSLCDREVMGVWKFFGGGKDLSA